MRGCKLHAAREVIVEETDQAGLVVISDLHLPVEEGVTLDVVGGGHAGTVDATVVESSAVVCDGTIGYRLRLQRR